MTTVTFSLILALLGAVFGSFAGAQVWRLRTKEFFAGNLEPGEVTKQERKKLQTLKSKPGSADRSLCLGCGHQLAWYDLLPVVSWVVLRGKCRYCRRPIGRTEFLLEIGLAFVFVVSYLSWPFALTLPTDFVLFGLWLVGMVLAAILFVYDLKWFILPDKINLLFALVGSVFAILALQIGAVGSIWSVVGSVAAISGLYLVLYLVSSGRWVGFGDVKLGVGLGLFLLDWKSAIVSVFLANLIGTVVILPLLMTNRLSRKSVVPFGPFLLVGAVFATLFGRQLIDFYFRILL